MAKSQTLPYLPTMFGTCMVFQTLYILCVALWFFFPDLRGHTMLADIIPGFRLLDAPSFVYGLIATALYGWFAAVVFTFFFNLWPRLAHSFSGSREITP